MTINYLNSGLEYQFYTIHEINLEDDNIYEDIEYNKKLFAKYHGDEGDTNTDHIEREEQLDQIFWEGLSYCNKYYEPSIFKKTDEKIAYDCGLIPIQYRGKNMLALCSNNTNVTFRLEAYKLLTNLTVDPNSKFFTREGKISKEAEYVIGKDIAKRILKII